MKVAWAFVVLLAFATFQIALVSSKYTPYRKQLSLNVPLNDTILPCSSQYYYVPTILGSSTTFLTAVFQEWTNTEQPVELALYFNSFSTPPIMVNPSCITTCEIDFFCGFVPGTYYVGVFSPSGIQTLPMNFSVAILTNTVPITARTVPFSYNVANSTRNNGAEPLTVDHYSVLVPPFSINSQMVVKVTNISVTNAPGGQSLSMCLNYGLLANSPAGQCFQNTNSSVNNAEFEIKVGSCNLQNGNYYASVQVPQGAYASYVISAQVIPTPVIQINTIPYKQSGLLNNTNDVVYYQLTYTPTQLDSVLVLSLLIAVGGTATISVNSTVLPGPGSCGSQALKTCDSSDVCIISIQPCIFSTTNIWYIAVYPKQFTESQIQYALDVEVVSNSPQVVTLDQSGKSSFANSVGEDQYQHYQLTLGSSQIKFDSVLTVQLYVNFDRSPVTLYMNPGSQAGVGYCYDNVLSCSTTGLNPSRPTTCHFTLQRCNLTAGTYYFSVFGVSSSSAYGQPISYTVKFNLASSVVLSNATSISQTVYLSEYSHYHIDLPQNQYQSGQKLRVRISDVANGVISGYLNLNNLAGDCPCYTSTQQCSGSSGSSCDLDVSFCDFTYGSWFISVFGQQVVDNTQPIGYTLTAFIEPPPAVTSVVVNSTTNGFIDSGNLDFYSISVASATPTTEFVVSLIIVHHGQDIPFAQLNIFLKSDNLADPSCFDMTCTAQQTTSGNAYCVLVLDPCEFFNGPWSITVQGDTKTTGSTHYTLQVNTRDVTPVALTNSFPVISSVSEQTYNQYYFTTDNLQTVETLLVEIYVSQNPGTLTLFSNVGSPAGQLPCYDNTQQIATNTTAYFLFESCQLLPLTKYYFGVFSSSHLFYETPIDYTITASIISPTVIYGDGFPIIGHVGPGFLNQYVLTIQGQTIGQSLKIQLHNVKGGSVTTFINYGSPAGSCPCYQNSQYFDGQFEFTDYFCEFQAGNYYIGVQGDSSINPYQPASYSLKVFFVQESIASLALNTLGFGTVFDDQISTFQLNLAGAPATGYLQVSLSNISVSAGASGELTLFINDGQPGSPGCAVTSCSASTGSNGCNVPVNACVFDPTQTWYLSVLGQVANNNKTATMSFVISATVGAPTSMVIGVAANGLVAGPGTFTQFQLSSPVIIQPAQSFQFKLFNITPSASLTMYVSSNNLAGVGSCLTFSQTCTASSFTGFCRITIPQCDVNSGSTYYVSVTSNDLSQVSFTILTGVLSIGTDIALLSGQTVQNQGLPPNNYILYSYSVPSNVPSDSFLLISTTLPMGPTLNVFGQFSNIPAQSPCNTYSCSGQNQMCNYYIPPCCLKTGGKYYTTIYNGGADFSNPVSFAITATFTPGNTTIPYPFGTSYTNPASGMARKQPQFLSTTIAISQGSAVTFQISATSSSLDVYFQMNTKAGSDGCYGNLFKCPSAVTPGSSCIVQLPPCAVANGQVWYITLNNTGFTDYPGFSIVSSEQKLSTLQMNIGQSGSVSYQAYQNYMYTWQGPAGLPTFSTSQLIYTLSVSNQVQTTLYLEFGSFAGTSNVINPLSCLSNTLSCTASVANNYQCNIPIPFCQTMKGNYYLSVYGNSQVSANYVVNVTQQATPAVTLAPNVPTWTIGTQNFQLPITAVQANQFLVLNVTQISNSFASVTVSIWSSCVCQNQALICTATSTSGCYIPFDPCTFSAGTYYIAANVNGNYNYTLVASIQGTVSPIVGLTVNTPYMDQLAPYQYQFYSVSTGVSNGAQSIQFSVSSDCGMVDFYVSQSGPATGFCNIGNCVDQSSCTYTIDACNFYGGIYYVTVFVRNPTYLTFNSQNWIPVTYTINVQMTSTPFTQVVPSQMYALSAATELMKINFDYLNIGAQLYFVAISQISQVTLGVRYGSLITSGCQADTTVTCQPMQECLVVIDPCDFQNGNYYVSVSGTNATFVAYYDPKTIPIIATNTPIVGSVAAGQYQYYKVKVDPTQPDFLLNVILSSVNGGTLQLFITQEDEQGEVPTLNCNLYSCGPTSTGCTVSIGGCVAETTYFIAVYGNISSSCPVSYSLTVQTQAPVISFAANVPICGAVAPGNTVYYHLTETTAVLASSSVTVMVFQSSDYVEVSWENSYLPTSLCGAPSCDSGPSGACNLTVCDPQNIYIAVTGTGNSVADFELLVILSTPTIIPFSNLPFSQTASGPMVFAFTPASPGPWDATLTLPSLSGSLYANLNFLATPICTQAPLTCTGGASCSISNYCINQAGTWYFYVDTLESFTLSIASPVSTLTQLSTTPSSGSISSTTPFNFYQAVAQSVGSAFLDITITSVLGGTLDVFIQPGFIGGNACFEENFQVTQAQGSFTYTFTPCQIANAASYFISISAAPTYSCMAVTYQISATPRSGSQPVQIDARTSYEAQITPQSPMVTYQLINIVPSSTGFFHLTISAVTGGTVSAYLYTSILGDTCYVANCTTSSSCFITLTCETATSYYLVLMGTSFTSCASISLSLYANTQAFTALSATATMKTLAGNDAFYGTVSSASTSLVTNVVLQSGPPVVVSVYEDICLSQLYQTLACTYGSDCKISIPTNAAHSDATSYYVVVQGSLSSYFAVTATTGTTNCGALNLPSTAFCNPVVTYTAWNYENVTARDQEAFAKFNWLLSHFTCGQTLACHEALQRYACYETFQECDTNGFYLGLCSYSCTDVSSTCGDWCAYGLDSLECTSNRYIAQGSCTGNGPITTTGVSTSTSSGTSSSTSGSSTGSTGSTSGSVTTTTATTVGPNSSAKFVIPLTLISSLLLVFVAFL